MMKKLLLFATCTVALCIHGTTLEEARQLIREDIELNVNRPPGYNERTKQMYLVLMALEWEVREPFYSEMLAEKFDNPGYVRFIMRRLVEAVHSFPAYENPETVDLVRRVLREQVLKDVRGGFMWDVDLYLSYKGDARDLDTMLMIANQKRLLARIAAANKETVATEEPAVTNVATASPPSHEAPVTVTQDDTPVNVTEDEPNESTATASPPSHPWLYALVPLFLCAGALLWFIRKK